MTLPHRPAASLFKSPHERTRPKLGDALTPAERVVLEWAAKGKSLRETGWLMFLRPQTVEIHRRNAYRKLGVRNAVQAANKLKAHG